MTKRVVHQKYLEAWLRGEEIQFDCLYGDTWCNFTMQNIESIDSSSCKFRITPKTIEVNITDFYAEYDKITTVNFRESFLEDLIAKYLPRESK